MVKKNWGMYVIASFFIVSLTYILIKQEGLILQVHDFLDNHINIFNMLRQNQLFWKFDGIIPILGGVTRNIGYYEFKVYNILFFLFPPFVAIIIGWYLKICVSILAFRLLLKEVDDEIDTNFAMIIGLLYGMLPVYPTDGLSFASVPLFLLVILKLYKTYKKKYLIILLLLPAISDFSEFGLFFCGYLLVFLVCDMFITRKCKWRLWGGLCSMSLGYIFTEWRLFYYALVQSKETIRDDFNQNYISVRDAVKEAYEVFKYGQYHSGDLHTYVVLPICTLYIVYLIIRTIIDKDKKVIIREKCCWIFGLIVLDCLIYGFDKNDLFRKIIGRFPLLGGFSFARTLWLNPFLWTLLFAFVIYKIRKPIIKCIVLIFAFGVVIIKPSVYNHMSMNLINDVKTVTSGKKTNTISFGEFYSSQLFDEIKDEINYNNEWCVAYGMHPAVIQFNGFHTLDGYNSFYPMEYKEKFRKIIAPDFKVDEEHSVYFDNWGARAYIYSNEIGYDPDRYFPESANLLIDVNAFKELGGKYIISRVEVLNATDLGIDFVGRYTDETSPYTIYVYSAN